jgi:hypothetical protein
MSPTSPLSEKEELTRLELLHEFKKHFGSDPRVNRSPFTEGRVVRYDTDVQPWDVPEIHREVRAAVTEIIQGIHKGNPSQVVILAGPPGMGKSHLINWFRSPQRAEELGYVLVCNANSWKVEEFEEYLLDGLLEALVRPSPNQPHLLLEKIHDIAFQALSQLLAQPGLINQFQPRGHPLRRFWVKLTGRQQARFQTALENRDPSIFRVLDFRKFASHVCDRFLHNGGNPFYRYVLQVLLQSVFEEDREAVLHWLRRRTVQRSFLKKLPAEDAIDRHYKVVDTLKILISLFTPEVADPLNTNGLGQPDKVFFFAFDQMEGRKELFEKEDDWFKFFAQMSELYNTLPNVFVLFTMTDYLRNQLYPKMERQFQQRIRRDHRFMLERLSDEEILAVYRHRIDFWLGDKLPNVRKQVENPLHRYLPFSQEEVLEMGGKHVQRTLREMLEAFDECFRERITNTVVAAPLDFLVVRNELREKAKDTLPQHYTESHLTTVTELFNQSGNLLAEQVGLSYGGMEPEATIDGLKALRLEFSNQQQNEKKWVRVFLVRLPWQYTEKLENCERLLRHKDTSRYFLWLVRAPRIADSTVKTWEKIRPGQIFFRELFSETEVTFKAMLHLLHDRDRYKEKEWSEAQPVFVDALKQTYVGEMLNHVAAALKNLAANDTEGDVPPSVILPTTIGQP